MEQKHHPEQEHRRMSKDELSDRLQALQSSSLDDSSDESSDQMFNEERETEFQAVLHELETYQIELEMQNRELLESREALDESHDRFVNLYDFAPIGYTTFDEFGVMKELNLTMASMLGVERRWLVDRSFSPWILGADLPVFRRHIKKSQSGEKNVESTLRLVRKDRQILDVELKSVCSTHRATGAIVLRTAVIDITNKKKLEEEMLATLSDLKEERKLREIFVSTLTHDLRTPLAVAKMGAQLILRNINTIDEGRDLAARILENIVRMDVMIHDLLDANRIRAGEKLPIKVEDCDLVSLVRKTLEMLKQIHGDRFQLMAPESCLCSIDTMGFRRVIENICNNAVKYGDKSAPILVTIENPKGKISLSIHNEGPIIPRKDQATLFDHFQRTQSAQTGGKKGWGIGLTLVRGLVESHGGIVRLVSEADKGTTFIVELPAGHQLCRPQSPDQTPLRDRLQER
jgi:PAS domain S-box-containing protein